MSTSNESAKVKFIKKWFHLEKRRLLTTQKLELLKVWIKSCASFEEYEMASALRTERGKTMKVYRDEKNGKRGIIKSIRIRVKYFLRKLKRKF